MTPPINPAAKRLRKTSMAELAGRIARVHRMDLSRLSDDEVKARIGPLMDGYATKTITIRTNGVFRARVVPDEVELFSNASELWYPPVDAVQRPGRFNRQGDVRFYCSNRPQAALLEMHIKPGDRLTLVVAASTTPACDVGCAHIGVHRCLEGPEVMGAALGGLREFVPFLHDLRAMGIENKWLRIDDYLTELAVSEPTPESEQDLYKATNAVSDVLYRIPNQQALIYPSVASGLHAFNMALPPEHADAFFFPTECWQFEIDGHREELPGVPTSPGGFFQFRVTARSTSIDEDGKIVWRAAQPDELPELQLAIQRAGAIRAQRFGG